MKRVVCAQDMGQAVNPEGAVLQMEGFITMGPGYALTEEVRFSNGRILDTNFDTYRIPRFSWAPKIETVLVDNTELPPKGGGEPAFICLLEFHCGYARLAVVIGEDYGNGRTAESFNG
ncbi:MAG: xanthine dehydrogenase family protein molybdopterin-binding subunit [Deltaproteobacteria bacterium]|nr:xanthine dehydrogenase family protein molybdopterin-binding subunit [Deltaproteobacteria bacterium]